MVFKRILTSLLIGSLLTALPAMGGILVRAYVDRTSVSLGESVQLRVTLTDADGTVDTSAIKDFKVFSRGTSTSVRIVNGRSTRQVTYSFMLIPTRSGTLTIPALAVDAGGQRLSTDPIQITVREEDSSQPAPQDRDVWVSVQVSDDQPFVGQQITYTFKLIHAVQVRNARFSPPAFEGFEAKELEERRAYPKAINGREHYVTEVYYVLIPKAAGPRVIAPAMLQVSAVQPRQHRLRSPLDDFFNPSIFNRDTLKPMVLQTKALNLDVRPLPAYTGVDPFSGLVGRFTLKAEAERTALKVGDSTTIALTLEGKGNLMDAPALAPAVEDAFKVYADDPEAEIHLEPSGYAGKKVFRTALVPVRAGRFEIAPVRLTYFDVQRQAYHTLSTDAIRMQVDPGEVVQTAPVAVAPGTLPPLKKKVEFTGRDILPPKEDLDALRPQTVLSPVAFTLWLALPVAVFGAVLLFQRLRLEDAGPTGRMKARARQALKKAARAGTNQDLLLGELYQALRAAILACGGQSGEALTWKEAEAILLRGGHKAQTAKQACDLLARIESGKYGGTRLSSEQCRALLDETRTMVRKLTP